MPGGTKFAALGGIAAGMGAALAKKHEQEFEEKKQHINLITGLVSHGIQTGQLADPNAAFKLLFNMGKQGGKDLPPEMQALVKGVPQAHDAALGVLSGPSEPPLTATSETGAVTSVPSRPSAPVTPIPQGSGGSGGALSWLTPDQIEDRAISRAGRLKDAQTQAEYQAKVNLATRMFRDGHVKSLEEGLTRVGLKNQMPTGYASFRPENIGLPLPVASVPPGALTVSGEPFNPAGTAWAQKTNVFNHDLNRWEIRYDPSGPPAAVTAASQRAVLDPAKFRERLTEILAANPELRESEEGMALARKTAGDALQQEAATAASIAKTRDQVTGEAAGTKAGPYDDLPTVVPSTADGRGDPVSQAAFLTALRKKPKGGILATNIQQAAAYKMPTTDFTSRQIGGLNRAEFVALVKQYDPTFDEARYIPRQDTMRKWAPGGTEANVMASARKIVNHLADFAAANKKMDAITTDKLGGIMNKGLVTTQRIIGRKEDAKKAQEALAEYETIKKGISSELRKFYAQGGSGGSLEELLAWEASFNPYGTSVERAASLKAAAHLMIGQVIPKVEQYRSMMGSVPPGDLWLSNKDRIRLRSMGVDTSDLPPLPDAEIAAANEARRISEKDLDPVIQGLPPGMAADDPVKGLTYMRDANGDLHVGPMKKPAAPKK